LELPSVVRFMQEEVKEEFYSLESGDDFERGLFKHINNALDEIEKNAFCGIQVPKKLIPKGYFTKFGIHNLWKANLPDGWRLIYCIESDDKIVVSKITEWLSHKEYERKFNY